MACLAEVYQTVHLAGVCRMVHPASKNRSTRIGSTAAYCFSAIVSPVNSHGAKFALSASIEYRKSSVEKFPSTSSDPDVWNL